MATLLADFKTVMGVKELKFGRHSNSKHWVAGVTLPSGITLNIYSSKAKSKEDLGKITHIQENDGTTNPDLKGTLWAVTQAEFKQQCAI